VRLTCGGNSYLPKEKLWPFLDEFTDKLIEYLRKTDRIPQAVHGHYADAGYVASEIASIFDIPLVFTAHSLGRNKLDFLLDSGMSEEQAEKQFNTDVRILNEEKILSKADLVVTSTAFERDELYSKYKNKTLCTYAVIPPGLDLDHFFPYYDYEIPGNTIDEVQRQAHFRVLNDLKRFHFEPDKPVIITLCRPDSRKNIDLLIDVYGKDKELQAIANLAVFAGIRDNIAEMEEGERQVLTDILLKMDQYDLYGKMAIPKNHNPLTDVPELYRIAAIQGGVFVSTSFLETFGLTLIESSASGLPFVATKEGGPVDIETNCKSGKLVDISKPETIVSAIKSILTDKKLWEDLSSNGINNSRKIYTWDIHCKKYLNELKAISSMNLKNIHPTESGIEAIGRRISTMSALLIVDIDDTLIGDNEATERLVSYLQTHHNHIGFGVATGRDIQSTLNILSEYNVPFVDILISSVGSEIYYSGKESIDKGWITYIKKDWKPDRIRQIMNRESYIRKQTSPESQRDFKISFVLKDGESGEEVIPRIHNILMENRLRYNLIFSHNNLIDILPYRAGKGKAIRYLANKWGIPVSKIITAGNSGNDADMLSRGLNGIIVGNYSPELEKLRKTKGIYFADKEFADGILEGLEHFSKIKN
ncbi:MAG: HAD-IIB family hydrolase, partial [Spirochaetia bacterium]|nr:HAD-IIB family hydrolase [Spirochaetia bacterium]